MTGDELKRYRTAQNLSISQMTAFCRLSNPDTLRQMENNNRPISGPMSVIAEGMFIGIFDGWLDDMFGSIKNRSITGHTFHKNDLWYFALTNEFKTLEQIHKALSIICVLSESEKIEVLDLLDIPDVSTMSKDGVRYWKRGHDDEYIL